MTGLLYMGLGFLPRQMTSFSLVVLVLLIIGTSSN
jgi:hypothetical protein